MNCEIN